MHTDAQTNGAYYEGGLPYFCVGGAHDVSGVFHSEEMFQYAHVVFPTGVNRHTSDVTDPFNVVPALPHSQSRTLFEKT